MGFPKDFAKGYNRICSHNSLQLVRELSPVLLCGAHFSGKFFGSFCGNTSLKSSMVRATSGGYPLNPRLLVRLGKSPHLAFLQSVGVDELHCKNYPFIPCDVLNRHHTLELRVQDAQSICEGHHESINLVNEVQPNPMIKS